MPRGVKRSGLREMWYGCVRFIASRFYRTGGVQEVLATDIRVSGCRVGGRKVAKKLAGEGGELGGKREVDG